MYVLTSYVWTLQNYKKFIDYQLKEGDIVICFLVINSIFYQIIFFVIYLCIIDFGRIGKFIFRICKIFI